jgi:thiamine-phosphate pyrophosphorylase
MRLRLSLSDASDALVEAGARILQIRWKDHFTRELFATLQEVAQRCRGAGAQLVINDRADMALLLDAGIHVGQDDLPPKDVRRVVGSALMLGYSTHNEAQLRAGEAEPVDYLALGPVFPTSSKQNPAPVVGASELARLRCLTTKPMVAIGGITRATAVEAWRAGADSVAVISDLYPEPCTKASVRHRFEEWMELAAHE